MYSVLGTCGVYVVFAVIVVLSFVFLKFFPLQKPNLRKMLYAVVTVGIFSYLWVTEMYPVLLGEALGKMKTVSYIIEIVLHAAAWLPVSYVVMDRCFDLTLFEWKKFLKSMLPTGVLAFTFFVFLPSDSYFANAMDFGFPYQAFIFLQLLIMLGATIVPAFVMSIMKDGTYKVIYALFMGLSLCVYVQYMFMNSNLKLIDGETMNWNEHIPFAVITGLIWLAILAAAVVTAFKWEKVWKKLHVFLPAVLGAVQGLALIFTIVTAGESTFSYKVHYMSAEEQFTVSKKDNLVVFILDAADNKYFKELLDEKPEVFNGYEDFTMFTNTCSVFDSTPTSITQMYTGMGFQVELPGKEWYNTAWNSTRTREFFGRLHEAGYIINGYSISSDTESNYIGLFDNCKTTNFENTKVSSRMVDNDLIFENFCKLSLYRTLPFALKRFAGAENITFEGALEFSDSAVCYSNSSFDENLNLVKSESDANYFITQHINGTHPPCNDEIGETVFLLEIIGKYIDQLKKLDLYENSTIVITSDHGEHNDSNPADAATPIFMVKRKGETKPEMTINNAPIYHEDFQATILDLAGLYNDSTDEALFGTSVFDIPEDLQRTRLWYDRGYDVGYPKVPTMSYASTWAWSGCNIYRAYSYTGDTSVLEEIVASEKYTIYPMTDNKG
ncbi:MAG: sulfatase-like hydrolase/transferase [Oscillospiraceae bacterium]